jgi:hypothetical protein
MKTFKNTFALLIILIWTATIHAQVDVGKISFNYEGVYHDNTGQPVKNAIISPVLVYYYKTTNVAGSPDYTEQFNSVKTDAAGLFTLALGTGTSLNGDKFSNIKWTEDQYFVKINIQGVDLTLYPVPLNAVPYAKVAGRLSWSDYAIVEEQYQNGQSAGATTDYTWTTRKLNTVTSSAGNNISLSNNQLILSPGRYFIEGYTTCYAGAYFTSILYDVANGTIAISGRSGYVPSNDDNTSTFQGIIVVTGTQSKAYELQMYTYDGSPSGLGKATTTQAPGSNAAKNEVFSHVFIQKID